MVHRALVALACLLLLAGCLPIPDVHVPLVVRPPDYLVDPASVQLETFWFATPPAPDTPAVLNRTGVRRSFLEDVPAGVVIVAMPGLFGGATTFDVWASQLIASRPGVEVWAIDRRANALEDREGIRRAMEAGDPDIAGRYYGRGGEFVPLDPAEVGFMAGWGLAVHLHDLHAVVLRARQTGAAVVLAGHSLGAGIVSVYPALQLPRELGGGIGEDYVEGLILFDGGIGRTGAFGRDDRRVGGLGLTIVPTIGDLESGRVAPFMRMWFGYGPERFIRDAVGAVYAQLRPDDLAPPEAAPYPVTNRALFGIRTDDDYAATPIFSASVGHAVGARFGGNLTAFLLTGSDGARSRTVAGLADGAERVTWSAGDPSRDVTDLDAVIATWTDPDADRAEWYFPLRLVVELIQLDPRLADAPGFVPMQSLDLPALAIGASRGLITSPAGFESYVNTRPGVPVSVTVIPGFTHTDVVTARANPAVPIVLRWLGTEDLLARAD
jgi:hypothetical protein